MFDYDKTLDRLKDFKKMSSHKREKIISSLLYDETFIEWLFMPKKVPNLSDMVSDIYAQFTKPIVMQTMTDVVMDEGPKEFNRSHATFLYTVANLAIQGNNDFLKEVNQKKKDGDMTSGEAKRLYNRIDDSNEIIADLMKAAKKIIKRDAARLADESHLPKYLCIAALHSVPEYKYIDKYKIGYYLNNLMNDIYSEVEENGEFGTRVKWRLFFKELFGKDNVVEVATFILLEGVHRINRYKNSDDVMECWDSLTEFALGELESSPQQIRQQMMELYIKRLDKMFLNKSYDLRVNMLDINKLKFPNLVDTIDKYTDRILSILNRGKDKDD